MILIRELAMEIPLVCTKGIPVQFRNNDLAGSIQFVPLAKNQAFFFGQQLALRALFGLPDSLLIVPTPWQPPPPTLQCAALPREIRLPTFPEGKMGQHGWASYASVSKS